MPPTRPSPPPRTRPLGLELPVALTLVASGETSLQWLAPDEWLLIVPGGEEYAVEQRLRQALGEELHYAVVNVSGGQTLLELSGANVREPLMKSTSYDVHPSNFPVGKAVGSIFAKSQCVIRHTGEDTWELVAPQLRRLLLALVAGRQRRIRPAGSGMSSLPLPERGYRTRSLAMSRTPTPDPHRRQSQPAGHRRRGDALPLRAALLRHRAPLRSTTAWRNASSSAWSSAPATASTKPPSAPDWPNGWHRSACVPS